MTSVFLLATAALFRTFTTEIDVTFATPEDARAAEAHALEMPPGKTIAFSSRWDDTNRRHPLMAKAFSAAGAKATFYLNGVADGMRADYTDAMLAAGHAFGGHSMKHPRLPEVDAGTLWWNVMENRVRIETTLSTCVCGFALPYYAATNAADPTAAARLGEALFRAGYRGGPEKRDFNSWKTYRLTPRTWVSAYCFDCQDSNPSAEKFAAGFAEGRRLIEAGALSGGPQLALGVHTRQKDEGLARLTEILKSVTTKPEVWCCTENEYVAWRLQYLNNRVSKVGVSGCVARFRIERVEPFELGGLADYALDFTRPAKGGVHIVKPDAAHPLPTAFGRLEKALAYDAAAGRVTLTLENPTDGDLSDIDLTLRLPLAWTNGVRHVNRPRLARGETLRETFAIGAPMPSEGNFLFVVQVDAKTSPTTRGRWYATANARGPWDFDIRAFGAVPEADGEATAAIEKAIAACRAKAGGRIVIPKGDWLTGPIRLFDNMTLHLEEGARLSFVTNFARYYAPPTLNCWEGVRNYGPMPCVYAYRAQGVRITGTGELNGNGAAWWPFKFAKGGVPGQRDLKRMGARQVPVEERKFTDPACGLRPNFVQFYDCDRVLVQDVTLRDGPFWNLHPFLCRDVVVRRVKFIAHGPNNDGVDPDCCQRVLIEDCFFDVGDDCVVLKAGWNEDGWAIGVPTKDVTVRRCRSVKGLGGLTFGSEISAGIENVVMEDCELNGCRDAIYFKSLPGRGGYVRNVLIRNVKIGKCIDAPIKLSLIYKKTPPDTPHVPDFSDIRIENVSIEKGSHHPIVVEGVPYGKIRNVVFENVTDASGRPPRVTDAENIVFNGERK